MWWTMCWRQELCLWWQASFECVLSLRWSFRNISANDTEMRRWWWLLVNVGGRDDYDIRSVEQMRGLEWNTLIDWHSSCTNWHFLNSSHNAVTPLYASMNINSTTTFLRQLFSPFRVSSLHHLHQSSSSYLKNHSSHQKTWHHHSS